MPILSLEDSKARLQGKSVVLGAITPAVEEEMRNLLSDSPIKRILSISELIHVSDLSHLGRCEQFDYSEVLDAIYQEGSLGDYLYHIQTWENSCRNMSEHFDRILKGYQEQKHANLADVGCGFGFWSLYFAERHFEVLGIDRDTDRLNVFRRIAEKHPNMTAMEADIRKMDCIPDNTQDVSFCANTTTVVPEWRKVILEMNKITRSNGIMILVIARPDHIYFQKLYHDSPVMQWDATQENIIKAAAPDAELVDEVNIHMDKAIQHSNEAAYAILVFAKR